MLPRKLANPSNQPTGRQVMATDIPELNLTVGYRVLQLARDVHPRERLQAQGIGEEADTAATAAARFIYSRARVIQQCFCGRGVLSKQRNARAGSQLVNIACQ